MERRPRYRLGGLRDSSFTRSREHQQFRTGSRISVVDSVTYATEWSGGTVIDLGGLPGFTLSAANDINDAGRIVGESSGFPPPVPEPSTWAMMLCRLRRLGTCRLSVARGLMCAS